MPDQPKFVLDVKMRIANESIWLAPVTNKATGKKSWAITAGSGYLTEKFKWSREKDWWENESKEYDPSIFLSLDEAKNRAAAYLTLKDQLETKASEEEITATIELLVSAGYIERDNNYHRGVAKNDLDHVFLIEKGRIFQQFYYALASALPQLSPGATLKVMHGGHATAIAADSLFIQLTEFLPFPGKVDAVAELVRNTLLPTKDILLFGWNTDIMAFSVYIHPLDYSERAQIDPFTL